MSDNLRRYRAIRDALRQGYPGQLTGRVARHSTTLAVLMSGIVGSKSTQLPNMAAHVPDGSQPESRVKRFTRWLKNVQITDEVYFVPYAEILLCHLALQTLVLMIDGSVVGRGCVALMMHVVYQGRALPCWAASESRLVLAPPWPPMSTSGAHASCTVGIRIGLAFYKVVLQGYGPVTELRVVRNRLVGIALGLAVFGVIDTPL